MAHGHASTGLSILINWGAGWKRSSAYGVSAVTAGLLIHYVQHMWCKKRVLVQGQHMFFTSPPHVIQKRRARSGAARVFPVYLAVSFTHDNGQTRQLPCGTPHIPMTRIMACKSRTCGEKKRAHPVEAGTLLPEHI